MSTTMNMKEHTKQQQPPAKKSRMDDTSSKEEPAEIVIQQDGATRDKQIRELETSTMDKKGELSDESKLEMITLKDEFAEKLSSLEEKYQKEIAEFKIKNQKLTEEFEEKIKKLEERIQMNEQKIGEAENEIIVAIHEMKVQLPPENWHDLLAYVPRSQLGNVVSQIGDRQFAYIIQSFLHDPVKEITLRNMTIIAPRPDITTDLPMMRMRVWPNPKAATNIPDWPMPGNIKDFKEIDLNYLDTSVLHFLGKFQENSLLTDVNMHIDCKFEILDENEDLPQALTKIAPFIASIDSITFPKIDLFEIFYDNDDEDDDDDDEASKPQLLKEMMAKTRILVMDCSIDEYNFEYELGEWENKMYWFINWLYTPRDDGKPRMLKSNYPIYVTECDSFIESITEDFEMANDPVSFIICTRVEKGDYTIEDISLENIKTNEQLMIKTKRDDGDWDLLISRYPLNAAKSWIEANEKEISEWNEWKLNRKINMDGELTINDNLKLWPDE